MTGLRGVKKGKATVTLFLLAACLAFLGESALADNPKPVAPPDMITGIVVTNHVRAMKIDKTNFPVSQHVIVSDTMGKKRQITEVMAGDTIKFHTTNGEIDRIECICRPTGLKPGSKGPGR
jgi:hypothetical protein